MKEKNRRPAEGGAPLILPASPLKAKSESGHIFESPTEIADDLASIAVKDLKSRQTAIYAKAAVRPVLKTAAKAGASIKTQEKGGDAAAYAVQGASSLFNLFSEQADEQYSHGLQPVGVLPYLPVVMPRASGDTDLPLTKF